MKSRLTILGTLLLLGSAVMFGTVTDGNKALAGDFSCHKATCPGLAQCTGDHWAQSGTCGIICYKDEGAPGQIVASASVDCAPSQSSGSGGGTVGFYIGDGGYCYDNWWWDTQCSGPDDPYMPPFIN